MEEIYKLLIKNSIISLVGFHILFMYYGLFISKSNIYNNIDDDEYDSEWNQYQLKKYKKTQKDLKEKLESEGFINQNTELNLIQYFHSSIFFLLMIFTFIPWILTIYKL